MSRIQGVAALAALTLTMAAPAAGARVIHPRAPRACADTGAHIGQVPRRRLVVSVVCLLNRQRHAHGLAPLHRRRRLAVAAFRHAQDMEHHRYFSHTSRSGASFVDRIRRAGYLRGHRCGRWTLGETLAWGGGAAGTPAALVRAFMHSPEHRRVILTAVYRDVGVGLAAGDPVGSQAGTTLAVDYGRRSGHRRDRPHGRRRARRQRSRRHA